MQGCIICTRRTWELAAQCTIRGTPHLLVMTTSLSCDSDGTDIDMIYRMCCITVPSYKAATLFDRGVHASIVNREVVALIEGQARMDPS